MTPVFASEDVAALVAAYPPPSPTRDQPSLVRSASGNRLLNSNHVLNRFQQLLETSPDRILSSDLRTRLDVRATEWLLETYDGPIRHNKDKSCLIPEPEYERIAEQLNLEAKSTFVPIEKYLIQEDLSPQCLDELVDGLCKVSVNATAYICVESLLAETKETINAAITDAGAEKIDLGARLPKVPLQVLSTLAKEVTTTNTGEVYLEQGDQILVFVPVSYTATQERERAAAFDLRVRELLSLLERDGLLHVPTVPEGHGAEFDEVSARYKVAHPGTTGFNTYKLDSSSVAWVPTTAHSEIVEQFKSYVSEFVDNHHQPDRINKGELDTYLIDKSERKGLARLLLRDGDRRLVDAALEEAIHQRDRRQFEDLFQTNVLAPAQLYAIGAECIEDAALKQRCEEHICEHFRKEVLPAVNKGAHEQSYKPRSKDLDKLLQSCTSMKTLADLNASFSKFTKKQKLSLPAAQQLEAVKLVVLSQKVRDVERMQRASDILQNVIWILLAQRHAGLFMSSGKDTGRMIKQYQILGDEGIGKELERWRDTLKKGEASEKMIEEMRALAAKIVEGMVGVVDGEPG